MKNSIHRTRRARRASRSVTAGRDGGLRVRRHHRRHARLGRPVTHGVDRRLRRRITDVRDRGALSLEQAIVTAVLSAAAIALGVVIVNAVVSHQNQIR